MNLVERIAIAAAAILLLSGVAAIFLPTSPQGATCGTWVSPEWTDEGTDDLVDQASDLAEMGGGAEAYAIAAGARTSKRLCDDALSTRRTVSIMLLGLGVLVPAGVLFVGSARTRREQPPTA